MSDEISSAEKKYIQKHSASGTIAGFDFQFFVFIYAILKIENKEFIEYETFDDIVWKKKNQLRYLIQAKHSTQENSNLTERDRDFWKSVSNWIELASKSENESFFIKNKFELWTNKKKSDCSLYSNIIKFKNDEITLSELDAYLHELKNSTKKKKNNANDETEIQEFISKLLTLDHLQRTQFLRNLEIKIFPHCSIITEIIDYLKSSRNITDESEVNNIFYSVVGQFSTDKYKKIAKGKPLRLKFKQIFTILNEIVNRAFGKNLLLDRTFIPDIPPNFHKSNAIQQLIDIRYINANDKDDGRDIYALYLMVINELSTRVINGSITSQLQPVLESRAKKNWKHRFRSACATILNNQSENEIIKAAIDCHTNTLNDTIPDIEKDFSDGIYYALSEKLDIGWRSDWKTKYKQL